MRAVLLAAGEGKRLRPHFNRPKPLIPLLGLSLIERNILALREWGVKEIVIITGCYDKEIREYLGSGEKLGVEIKYLYNPDWQLGNGVSAYTFHQEYRQDEKFVLMMCDHMFQPDILKDFIAEAQNLKPGEVLLAADRRLEKIYDLEECTKVKAKGNNAVKLGKGLDDFNAVDCGMFMGTRVLLEALSQAISQKKYAFTDAINILAASGRVKLHFIQGPWVDVDDLESFKEAEKILLRSLVPAKDSFVSKYINRKFSLRITKHLSETGITANQITVISVLIALASAFCFAAANPILGGLLAQVCSIADGVDGEIARLKYLKSNFGGIFDAILDRYADFIIVIGMTYSWYFSTYSPAALLIGAVALIGMPMSMLFKEKFHALTGKQFLTEVHDGFFRYLPANRDGRLFIVMLGGIFNLIPAALIFLAVITHLQTFFRLYNARKLMLNPGGKKP